ALASDGTSALAVWTDVNGEVTGDDCYALPVDPTQATLTAAASKLLTVGRSYELTRAIASDGNVFLAVWEDDRNVGLDNGMDIYGIRFGLDGKPTDAAPFVPCGAPCEPS